MDNSLHVNVVGAWNVDHLFKGSGVFILLLAYKQPDARSSPLIRLIRIANNENLSMYDVSLITEKPETITLLNHPIVWHGVTGSVLHEVAEPRVSPNSF